MHNTASKIIMVRPVKFGFNEQTAGSNSFQQKSNEIVPGELQHKALQEFDAFVNVLKSKNIDLVIFDDTVLPLTPDSVFPNNWISFHSHNKIVLYPMLAENRRHERRSDIIDYFRKENTELIDYSEFEKQNQFLEGTGSIVFDYENRIAYANISARTNKQLFEQLCEDLNYQAISFRAIDENGMDIYHTNVLLCIGKGFAVICPDCFPDKTEFKKVSDSLTNTGHELIIINYDQLNSFAGNMYQLFNETGESFIVLSEQAYKSLSPEQIVKLEKYGTLTFSALYTIEKYGGGSARCMLADVYFNGEANR